MKNISIFFLILFSAYTALAQVEFENIDLSNAITKARKSEKNILIYFYCVPCPACTLLTKHIFKDAVMGNYINSHYVSFKVYGNKSKDLQSDYEYLINKYQISRGFPVVLLLDSDGQYIDRIRGFGDKEDYIKEFKNYTNGIETLGYFEKKVKENPKDCESLVALARKYHNRRMRNKALELYEKAVQIEPCSKDGLNWFALSNFYKSKGMTNKAIAACEKAVELDPEHSQYKSLLEILKK